MVSFLDQNYNTEYRFLYFGHSADPVMVVQCLIVGYYRTMTHMSSPELSIYERCLRKTDKVGSKTSPLVNDNTRVSIEGDRTICCKIQTDSRFVL